jgi:integrase
VSPRPTEKHLDPQLRCPADRSFLQVSRDQPKWFAASENRGVGSSTLPLAIAETCATMLFRHGANAKQVRVWLGHHSPAFTLATYVHLLAEDAVDPGFLDLAVGTPSAPARGATDEGKSAHA